MIARFRRFHRDARVLLVTTLVTGAALSLYWIDFNLYLASLGHSSATIGLVATVGSTAGALAAFPASAISDRVGRRAVMIGGIAVALAGDGGAARRSSALPLIVVSAALWSIGQQSLQVVQAPFMAEHSDPEHRNELFALQAALFSVTSVIAAALGGVVATWLGGQLGFDPGGPGTYRIILVMMAGLLVVGLATVTRLRDDRPRGGDPDAAARTARWAGRFATVAASSASSCRASSSPPARARSSRSSTCSCRRGSAWTSPS